MYRKTYIEINLDNLCHNIKNIVNTFNDYKYYIGVIKGNAYGHGEYISKYITECGINYLAVSTLEEAINVRKYVDKDFPILCLQPISLDYINEITKYNITICISDIEYFNKLKDIKLKKNIKFHLKLNTGMNRLGINDIHDVNEIFNTDIKNLEFEGIFTHLCTNGLYDDLYDKQIKRFRYLTSEIDLSKIKIVHIARSTTLDFYDKLDICNGCRIGIMMYGISSTFPSTSGFRNKLRNLKYENIRKKYHLPIPNKSCKTNLKQALSLKSEVLDVQKVKYGDYVGYGSNTRIFEDCFVATIPVGYCDGLLTNYNNFYVFINGIKYKVIGSINMGMVTVLVDKNVKIGDIVTVISKEVNYKSLASNFKVTPYVLLTNLSKTLPHIYIKDNKIIKEIEV